MSEAYDYGWWGMVALNVIPFLAFTLAFLMPRGRLEWRNFGVMSAFFGALFTEMYGPPLTIYLLTGWLGAACSVLQPFSHKYGHLWVVVFGGSDLAWALVMAVSLVALLAGYGLMARGALVSDGVYAHAAIPSMPAWCW